MKRGLGFGVGGFSVQKATIQQGPLSYDEGPKRKLMRIDDDDEDEFNVDEIVEQTMKSSEDKKEDEEEEDPLEAYMNSINKEVEKEPAPKPEKSLRTDLEEQDDYVESYIKMMEEKGHEFGKTEIKATSEDANSDEEVYAAEKAADEAAKFDADGNPIARKDVEPLPAIDHSKISYIQIEKNFYEEHPDIQALAFQQVAEIRRTFEIRVSGNDVAKPAISFAHFGFDEELMKVISNHGYSEPTAIQKQAITVALNGRDIIGIAKTGSGKTAAFLLPMLVHMMDQPELEKGDGPIGIVLAPTRELCVQIYNEAKKFAKAYSIQATAIYGGASKLEQFKELRKGFIEIIVATPGRLIDLIKMKATSLKRVSYVVLDEADRMFDLGFEPQARSILQNVRPDRQTLLFSATFPKKVEKLANDVLTDPVRITVGGVGEANADITQTMVILRSDDTKWPWLISHLAKFTVEGSVLIFVSKRGVIDELTANLNSSNFPCACIHGDLLQGERDKVIKDFKKEKVKILVATDVASRGLDIPTVKTVVNYEVARDIDSHIHRIGRTGRAGQKGFAYTLLTERDDKFAGDLVKNLEYSGQPVPEELLQLAMKNPKFQNFRSGGKGRRAGIGRGGKKMQNRMGIGAGPDSSNSSNASQNNHPASFNNQRSTGVPGFVKAGDPSNTFISKPTGVPGFVKASTDNSNTNQNQNPWSSHGSNSNNHHQQQQQQHYQSPPPPQQQQQRPTGVPGFVRASDNSNTFQQQRPTGVPGFVKASDSSSGGFNSSNYNQRPTGVPRFVKASDNSSTSAPSNPANSNQQKSGSSGRKSRWE